MKLFIDDERMPPGDATDWHIVRTSQEAIAFVQNHGVPALISFDHDLGGEDTAMNFVRWLIDLDLDINGSIPADFSFEIHSQNPVGALNIRTLLESYLAWRHRCPES